MIHELTDKLVDNATNAAWDTLPYKAVEKLTADDCENLMVRLADAIAPVFREITGKTHQLYMVTYGSENDNMTFLADSVEDIHSQFADAKMRCPSGLCGCEINEIYKLSLEVAY